MESQFDQRLSRLEATVEALAGQIKTIATSLHEAIDKAKTDWGTLASWAAVVIATVTAIGALGVARPLAKVELAQQTIIENMYQDNYNNGKRDGKLEDLFTKIEYIDKRLHTVENSKFDSSRGKELEDKVYNHHTRKHMFGIEK